MLQFIITEYFYQKEGIHGWTESRNKFNELLLCWWVRHKTQKGPKIWAHMPLILSVPCNRDTHSYCSKAGLV